MATDTHKQRVDFTELCNASRMAPSLTIYGPELAASPARELIRVHFV